MTTDSVYITGSNGALIPVISDIIPAGKRNRPGGKNSLKYITIHNTGNTGVGANARAHASYLKSASSAEAKVSWHYTVDDKEVYHHIPDSETAWHAGDAEGNSSSIGIEICMNSDGDLERATENAVALTARLCREHGIPVENIRQHYHWTKKNCPQMIKEGRPYGWTEFLARVRTNLEEDEIDMEELKKLQEQVAAIGETVRELSEILLPKYDDAGDSLPDWARPTIEKLIDLGYLKGDDKGRLRLSYNDLRQYVVNDRAGLYS